MSYFDIDEIIAQQEKLICKIQVPDLTIAGVNCLQHTRTEMPFWIACILARYGLVTLEELPRCLKDNVLQDLDSVPEILNLRELSTYFYRFAIIILETIETSPQLKRVLVQSFQKRIAHILQRAYASRCNEKMAGVLHEYVDSLEEMEKQMYLCAIQSFKQADQWWNRDGDNGKVKLNDQLIKM
ncbi:hypothetical protein MIR68_010541 [Amoeboaphelidium protococcarum]|nr:hypothetical protein MIR68_010541 [Amoeboaphelidium protococcarum]